MQESPAANQFIDRLLQEKGVEGIEEGIRLQLHQELLTELENRINRAIIDALSSEQLAKFEHLIDTNQLHKLHDFLTEQGVNVNGIIARCMSEFQASYLGT